MGKLIGQRSYRTGLPALARKHSQIWGGRGRETGWKGGYGEGNCQRTWLFKPILAICPWEGERNFNWGSWGRGWRKPFLRKARNGSQQGKTALRRHRNYQAAPKVEARAGSLPQQIFITHPGVLLFWPRGPVLKLQKSVLLSECSKVDFYPCLG